MEAVPIRNCSSTLPPLSRGILPSKSLCRNLFGPVDHDELKTVLDHELEQDQQQKSEEWCFNFSEGTPILNGRLIWKEVTPRDDEELSTKTKDIVDEERRVPDLHAETGVKENDVFETPQRVEKTLAKGQSMLLKTKSPAQQEPKSIELKSPLNIDRKRKKQFKTITDFMKQKKRRRVSHSSVSEKTSNSKTSDSSHCAKDDLALGSPSKMLRVAES